MRKFTYLLILLSINSLAFAQVDAGYIGTDQGICYGTAPQILNFTVQPSGGTLPYTYRWQRSNDNGASWYDISGTSASRNTYYPPVLGRTTRFRCRVTDANSVSALSHNDVTITVSSDFSAGAIVGNQTIYRSTAPIMLIETEEKPASGGSGAYTYQWQSSGNGTQWSDISGATEGDYSPSILITDTWFRRFVTDGTCGSSASNSVKITVNPITLYTSEVPSDRQFVYDPRDYGTEFQVLTDGFITAVRLYCHNLEGGIHQIRLWRQNDLSEYELIAGPTDWDIEAGTTGWLEYEIAPTAVEANRNYIVSITNGTGPSQVTVISPAFTPVTSNEFITYIRGLFGSTPGVVPSDDQGNSYFRDIVFVPFSAGEAGTSQSICYNAAPAPLTETVAPSGGSGVYEFQWQSLIGSDWTDISGATSANYAPSSLTVTTNFRRNVISEGLTSSCPEIIVVVSPEFTVAQLHNDITIYENTSTYLNVALAGGTPPYSINYTRNGIAQTPVSDYESGTDIYTGILSAGTFTYALTSVTDAFGCEVQSLGAPIVVTSSGTYAGSGSCKTLVLVNSSQEEAYSNYNIYLKPYLDWFGIPYETFDVNSANPLPDFNNYALIVFGHEYVYPSGDYPYNDMEEAADSGVGIYSFDPDLFNHSSVFTTSGTHQQVISTQINLQTNHYITQYHVNDIYNPSNDTINLIFDDNQPTIIIGASGYQLTGGTVLATMSDTISTDPEIIYTEPLLEVSENEPSWKIVSWKSYDWAFDRGLGPVMGMDDIVWRSMVWAAKKPFVMQGLPPMITMRMDDVYGDWGGASIAQDLEWLKIANEYGFIPWCGTFIDGISQATIDTLRSLTERGLTTSSPHSFSTEDYLYSDWDDPNIDVLQNIADVQQFYSNNSLPMSKFMVPHGYSIHSDVEISEVLDAIRNMGVEFIGTVIPYNVDINDYPGPWLQCGPYKIGKEGYAGGGRAYFYGGNVDWLGTDFFICVTEIRDDQGYDFVPTQYYPDSTIAHGVRQLRRALNSMVLPTLFSHEYNLGIIEPAIWRAELSGITQALSSYNPEYKSMDDAVEYIRAKENIDLTNVTENNGLISITCLGVNDMETKCYLFDESGSTISSRLITLPQVTSSSVPVTIGVSNN